MTKPQSASLWVSWLVVTFLAGGGWPGPAAYAAPESAAAAPRASMVSVQIPSHGSLLNGFVYVAAGEGPHPAVILLHGFPGNERNLDLAQDIRAAGWDVLYFNYRGSWGTPGKFSFTHGIEDTAAAVAYLRQPETAKKLHLDPKRIVLIGHSMGGFMAVQGAAADSSIQSFAVISAADLRGMFLRYAADASPEVGARLMGDALAKEGMAPLAGCTPQGLAREVSAHPEWAFSERGKELSGRTVLVVSSDDGLLDSSLALTEGLHKIKGDAPVTTVHLPTDHAYSDQRHELSNTVLHWLAQLP